MSIRTEPKLQTLLKYRNQFVIEQFSKNFGLTQRQSEVIFKDMLRFIWLRNKSLCPAKQKHPILKSLPRFAMLHEWLIIDEMWHTFILFSASYRDFCLKYFGAYLDHLPSLGRGEAEPEQVDMDLYIDLIYDEFGPAVANRWFMTYSKQFSHAKILRLQLSTHLASQRRPARRKSAA
jgi:hypothetical protein